MTASIFRHEDRDGEELDVYRVDGEALVFHATEHVDHLLTSVHLDMAAVIRLRETLTDWIGDRNVTYPVPNYTTPSDVRFIVSQVLAQVLPLHQSPQASVPAALCTLPGCDKFPESSEHFEHDPEPRDVGHPDPVEHALADPSPNWSDALFGYGVPRTKPNQLVGCECGHGWGVHEAISGGCTARVQGWGGPSVCTCTRTPPSAS